jgi:hypothetical protein
LKTFESVANPFTSSLPSSIYSQHHEHVQPRPGPDIKTFVFGMEAKSDDDEGAHDCASSSFNIVTPRITTRSTVLLFHHRYTLLSFWKLFRIYFTEFKASSNSCGHYESSNF